ncbi:A/G-specific adenine glycosylase [uncultured Maribacter sp.]|uniref:A/G-specific adenine glycosylase n=1 Tax=uncultured Maribacter sp. TaxID=431308 RepID=UPI002615AFF8|nr:A/G-specific adenine glycosylase [uncultured Maribacter sp.]
MLFSHKILLWYSQNKRTLPWRGSIDPYKIWLSEIILQQTKVAQGTPYYLKFVSSFPTVFDLANAPQEKILKLWQGLGYYSRARNLHEAAKTVLLDYNGKFPETYKELIKLKGIGDYTASAIASICFNAPEAVVDGNVYRVLSRYFGVDTPINSTEGVAYFKDLAKQLIDRERIRDYNQGIMEFGAMQCVPKNPKCKDCPLQGSCVALKENKVSVLPVKLKKTKIKKRYFNYIVPIRRDQKGEIYTILKQRIGKGIWQDLWEFPLIETEKETFIENMEEDIPNFLDLKSDFSIHIYKDTIVHKLSHQHLYTKFWIVEVEDEFNNTIKVCDLEKYAVPVLIADFIKTFKF